MLCVSTSAGAEIIPILKCNSVFLTLQKYNSTLSEAAQAAMDAAPYRDANDPDAADAEPADAPPPPPPPGMARAPKAEFPYDT